MRHIADILLLRMAEYEKGCPKRLQHLLKVHAFAALIGRSEKLEETVQNTLELAAILQRKRDTTLLDYIDWGYYLPLLL